MKKAIAAINGYKVHLKKYYIDSMIELIKRYEAALALGISKEKYEEKNGLSCLLCKPIGLDDNFDQLYNYAKKGANNIIHPIFLSVRCKVCPWSIIAEKSCICSRVRTLCIHETTGKVRIQGRIAQLRKWIEIYKNAEDVTDRKVFKQIFGFEYVEYK